MSEEEGITVTVFCNEVSAFVKCKRKVVVDESFNKAQYTPQGHKLKMKLRISSLVNKLQV